MRRSFTDRVFGGVCGGLGASLRVSAWWLRALFIILAFASAGIFALTYVLLWWFAPQDTPVMRRPGLSGLLVLLLLAGSFGLWAARLQGLLVSPTGQELFVPALLLVGSAGYCLRQLGGRV